MVLKIASMSCRSTLASCSGEITKWSFSSVVSVRTDETAGAPVDETDDVGAAVVRAAPAGADRVVGPEAAVGAG
eukprot:1429548-Pleurochrysis_carterae.AAC.1